MDNGKIDRVLGLYLKFMQGLLVNKAEEALNYGVNERTIQRDKMILEITWKRQWLIQVL